MSLRNALNGVFAIYKPTGWTSRDAINYVQNSLSKQLRGDSTKRIRDRDKLKIGHGGTLDPLAEGVLTLGVGSGCKQLHGLLQCSKEYEVQAKLGYATDTYDSEGQVTHKSSGATMSPSQSQVLSVLDQFRGQIQQVPPIYSAISIQGKRAYDYARQGIPLPKPIEPRTVDIHELELLDYYTKDDDTSMRLKVRCGGGTYMRSLVHDIGIELGCYGHMTGLLRTEQGGFTLDDCLTIIDANGNRCISLEDVIAAIGRRKNGHA
ncbi:tRNA pseudouridine(55) synthase [Lichtheimia ornata]|uniref:tRNA pseudouridine(55) synthase n=1 Tax=Lichtheimia ornata TaxID=688661 RepID=A0AAD7V8F6_9FUNG|nr:tRNA pseudouridine(55) synthase [Lichtheimia ornata]KAJ8660912.1 tRNA pseudouridine(55) synthase [Lichtheimia ornata]